MKNNSVCNLIMLGINALLLVAMNAAIWMAAERGLIAAIDNMVIWGAFVGVNIISLVWAVSMLGLQPLLVSLSYGVGGGIAWFGVRGMTEVNMAEMMTAGATYGAFGVLAVGHATTKVRLAFFNRGQVPFALIMVGLLVVDGLLNSRISQATPSVLLNAVALPFLIAGAVPGTFLMFAKKRHAKVAVEAVETAEAAAEPKADRIDGPMPEEIEAEPAPAPQIIPVETPAVLAEADAMSMAEADEPEVEEEVFVPFEIDGSFDEDDVVGDELKLLESMVMDENDEPAAALNVLAFEAAAADEHEEHADEPETDVAPAAEKVIPITATPAAENVEEKTEAKDDDWLSGHLELLRKIS